MLASLRLTIGSALLGAFIGEFIAADKGLGYMIIRAAGLFDTPRVLVGVFTIVAIALLVDRLIEVVEKRTLKWMPRASASAGHSYE
jgi:NitT/TauT family transport system permease protein